MNPNPDRSAKGASLLAIGSAVAASACCIGPTVLLALGIGGLGFASFLEPYRPYLLGLTALFLSAAFYMAYRPQKVESCATDGSCRTRSRRNLRIGVWSAAIVALLASAYPKIEAARAGSATQLPTADATSIVLDIEGMTCSACARTIADALTNVDGVRSASVDYGSRRAVVELEGPSTPTAALLAAVEGTGYRATLHPSDRNSSAVPELPAGGCCVPAKPGYKSEALAHPEKAMP